MAVPDFQTMMLPVLQTISDGAVWQLRDLRQVIANHFNLTEEERTELLPSGKSTTLANRVSWAKTYMEAAGLIQSVARGKSKITELGLGVIRQQPELINIGFLEQFESFVEFRNFRKSDDTKPQRVNETPPSDETPEEALHASYQQIRDALADELLNQVLEMSWQFFERLVLDLMLALGYGAAAEGVGARLTKSGADEGIDGIINEDRLGLDVIYLQAKRWGNSVGRKDVQGFVGALQGQRARKGVFITTSTFTKGAVDYARSIELKVILIDGKRLAQLMIDADIGVDTVERYSIKRLDSDYFSEV